MHVEFAVPDHAALIERLLDGFIQAAELLVRSGAAGKPSLEWELVDDGDPEQWKLPNECAESKQVDCEDLVIAWAGYLRATGEDPRAGARVATVSPGHVHCLLRRGDGRLVDVWEMHRRKREQYQMTGLFSFVGDAAKAVGRGVSSAAKGVAHGVAAVGSGVVDATRAAGRGVSSAASGVYHGVGDAGRAVGRGVGDAASFVGHLPGQALHGAGGILEDIGHGARDFASSAGNAIGDVAGGAAGLVADVAEFPLKFAGGIVGNVLSDARGALEGLMPGAGAIDPYAGMQPPGMPQMPQMPLEYPPEFDGGGFDDDEGADDPWGGYGYDDSDGGQEYADDDAGDDNYYG